MIIYGVAILSFCFLLGKLLGYTLGSWIGIDGDVGGVGFAMLLLMLINLSMKRKGWVKMETTQGILFWSSMYLPIIVAMAATRNVNAAISSGPVAAVAGVAATLIGFAMVKVISKIGREHGPD